MPFPQWYALRKLDLIQPRYEQGDAFALMHALYICVTYDVIIPLWVALPYIKAFKAIVNYESKDWNEVLGRPFPKNVNLNAKRKKYELLLRVYDTVNAFRRSKKGRALDAELFEEVGKHFNIGKTLAQEYYYEAKKILQNPPDEVKMMSYITHKSETKI